MRKQSFFLFLLLNSLLISAQASIEIPVLEGTEIIWENSERTYYSALWQTEVLTNVSKPSLVVFSPTKETNHGGAVIIAPGGGLYALSITSEGYDVAKWLTNRGFTAFVLKYRLVPTGEDGVAEIGELMSNNPRKLSTEVAKIMPLSVTDGLNSLEYVRKNAEFYGIDTAKIGFMGFSAGGAIAMGVAYNYTQKNRPDFLVPVYPWTSEMPVQSPKKDAPPMLVICAADDEMGLAAGSILLYNSWYNQGLNVGLHMFSKGGHGFGMRKKGLASDNWIEQFYNWSITEGFVPANKKP